MSRKMLVIAALTVLSVSVAIAESIQPIRVEAIRDSGSNYGIGVGYVFSLGSVSLEPNIAATIDTTSGVGGDVAVRFYPLSGTGEALFLDLGESVFSDNTDFAPFTYLMAGYRLNFLRFLTAHVELGPTFASTTGFQLRIGLGVALQ